MMVYLSLTIINNGFKWCLHFGQAAIYNLCQVDTEVEKHYKYIIHC